jgi:hypothetical protein
MGGCFQGQGGALRRDQLCVAGESCAGAGAISQAHVQRLIDAAVLLIAEDYAMSGDGAPTRGNVLSAFVNEWSVQHPDVAVQRFGITKALALKVLRARPAWRVALSEGADDAGDDKLAVKLDKLARGLLDPQKSLLCGKMPENVRKRQQLQKPGVQWDGVVAWSQSPSGPDDERQQRREAGMARLEAYLSHSAFAPIVATHAHGAGGGPSAAGDDSDDDEWVTPPAAAVAQSRITQTNAAASTPPPVPVLARSSQRCLCVCVRVPEACVCAAACSCARARAHTHTHIHTHTLTHTHTQLQGA